MIGIRDRATRWVWLLAGAMLVACASAVPALPALPGRGGPAWVEVKSEHFTLWTDAPVTRGRALVREFERLRLIVVRAMNHAPVSGRAFVIAPRSDRELAAFVPPAFRGMAWPKGNPSRQAAIAINADKAGGDVLSHELTHVISMGIFRHQPSWLAEGIATYFEMTDLESDAATATVGMPNGGVQQVLRLHETIGLADLFACQKLSCRTAQFYATSWALFSFLVNTRLDQLARYMQRLDQGVEPGKAWREAFADVSLGQLEHQLWRWLVDGDIALPTIAVTTTEITTTDRALGDGDVLASRALLSMLGPGDRVRARADAEAAIAADRTSVLAHLVRGALTEQMAPDDARAVATAHPDDWRAWWLVAVAVGDSDEARGAVAMMCVLAPGEAPGCGAD